MTDKVSSLYFYSNAHLQIMTLWPAWYHNNHKTFTTKAQLKINEYKLEQKMNSWRKITVPGTQRLLPILVIWRSTFMVQGYVTTMRWSRSQGHISMPCFTHHDELSTSNNFTMSINHMTILASITVSVCLKLWAPVTWPSTSKIASGTFCVQWTTYSPM